MACCAFAVFLLGQIVFAFDRARDFVFGVFGVSAARPDTHDLAASWRPGCAMTVVAERSWHLRRFSAPRLAVAAVCLELVVATGGVVGWSAYAGQSASLDFAMAYICRGGQILPL